MTQDRRPDDSTQTQRLGQLNMTYWWPGHHYLRLMTWSSWLLTNGFVIMKTQTWKQEYASAGKVVQWLHILQKLWNFLIHLRLCTSRLCMKMLSFLYACACAMSRTLYSSCGILFPVWAHDNIPGLTSFVVWLSRWEVLKKIQVIS